MRIAALEEELLKLSLEDLDQLVSALDVALGKLPEQLIQELGLRTLRTIVALVVLPKKGGQNGKQAAV